MRLAKRGAFIRARTGGFVDENKLEPNSPKVQAYHRERLINRDIDQLLGICEFALLDGCIDQSEAECILAWLNRHEACLDTWPSSVLYDRLNNMLADGILDDEEQRELLALIMSISSPATPSVEIVPSGLPLDEPAPDVVIAGKCFCFTGVFSFGTRSACEIAIQQAGGSVLYTVTRRLDYLVIGDVGSKTWLHTSFGSKIKKAVEMRDAGRQVAIISEQRWLDSMT